LAVEDVLALVDPPLALTLDLHAAARLLAPMNQHAFYDALIVAAAVEAGCDRLYSEDLQNGRDIGGTTIINPFAPGGAPGN
jgi:predicted nucleic acid-binding protein